MSLVEFIDALPALTLQGWHITGLNRLRNQYCQCPLTALAEMRGHKVCGSFVRARMALKLSASDARSIMVAADGIRISENSPLRSWMKAQLQAHNIAPQAQA